LKGHAKAYLNPEETRNLNIPFGESSPFRAGRMSKAGTDPHRLPPGRRSATMARTVEINEDLAERIDDHRREGETMAEFIEELVNIYEQEGRFSDRGL
jgi:hypothetical protein